MTYNTHGQRITRDDQLASAPGVSEITIAESSTRGGSSLCDTSPASIGRRSGSYEIKDETVNLPRRVMRRVEHAILNISPAFFSFNMGTGITSILLYNLPFNGGWLRRLGVVVFIFNVVLFILFAVASVVRVLRWKGIFSATLKNPSSGLYWGTLPMGVITIVNMIAFTCVRNGKTGWAKTAIGIWWIDVIFSVIINLGMVYIMIARQSHTTEAMSAAWLLPIVTCVVASSSGGVVSSAIMSYNPQLARSIIIVSYIVWGIGVPFALFVMCNYLHRSFLYGAPPVAALTSTYLPLGPCGQGSFGIMALGKAVHELAYNHGIGFAVIPDGVADAVLRRNIILQMADAVYTGSLVAGLILWGLSFCWYVLATTVLLDHWWNTNREYFGRESFSVGFTALIFPIGVWATATTTLATEFDSLVFKILGTIISIQVVFNWIYVMLLTIYKVCDGTLFLAPELDIFPERNPPLRWVRHASATAKICRKEDIELSLNSTEERRVELGGSYGEND
ncbi:sulfite transporter [Cryptococcus neoformans]|nr:sulfite transporter [Cryptococcus neoformans var. grubii c45]OXB39666.1 sulfite transporter [Cryptococcus neoformans var. grubii]OXC65703.1 sulfite transporter [Cryptococcus neoformans var. grubii MW-RSA852]